ncbi:MAG: DMT family transporter [Rubrobacteraceae bacterium]
MRFVTLLAVLAGIAVAFQASLTAEAQRTLGPTVLVAISGLTTSLVALVIALFFSQPVFSVRAVGLAAASGVLGAVILGSIAYVAGQDGVARAFSLVIATQLLFGLALDALGLFGAGAAFSVPKVAGVLLIMAGGVLVVRY